MELQLPIERLQAHQVHNPDKPQMPLQHLINRLHPVHQISQPRPGQRDHLGLPVEAVWELEDDKHYIVIRKKEKIIHWFEALYQLRIPVNHNMVKENDIRKAQYLSGPK